MAGIYIHIPFCKKRCIYCDFYSTTLLHRREAYVEALCRELRERKDYLRGEAVRTVYLGGGTPSLMDVEGLRRIFQTVGEVYGLAACEEVTMEANPDDLTPAYIEGLRSLPVNRLSIGIQTFDDGLLRVLNRRHTAAQALRAVKDCREAGLSNISIDLIYGLPDETEAQWEHDLRQAAALDVQHVSAYHLTYEEGTALWKLRERGRLHEVSEERSLRLFSLLRRRLREAGFEHYEISNFCLPGYHSRHNSAYWEGVPYLGCGAAAHSYDGTSRQWNVASLQEYVRRVGEGEPAYTREELDLTTRYNEEVMVRLRTAGGIDLGRLRERFGTELHDYCLRMAAPGLAHGRLAQEDGRLRLTESGIFVSDDIISELFYI